MQGLKVLFIVGFGPIVQDKGSRKLYRDTLGVAFKV
jgi:hypothetical protein